MAIVAHTAWKKRLHDALNTGHVGHELESKNCELSKWLKDNADELSLYEHYNKVSELHDKLHQEADKIIRLARSGKREEAKAAANYGSEFEHISQQLVQNIIAWHDVVIGKND
jgi:hypothetical protein